MVHGASKHFGLAGWDYDAYIPIVQGALEDLGFLIVASKSSPDQSIFRAAPRASGSCAVEVDVRRRPKTVDVHVLVYPLAQQPTVPDRFLISEGGLQGFRKDAQSRVLLGELLATLRRDPERTPREVTKRPARGRAPPWLSFQFEGGRLTWLLGSAIALGGVSYVLFFAPEGEYQTNAVAMAVLVFATLPYLGGLWGRSGARGAVTGMLAVYVPTFVYSLAMAGYIATGIASTEALASIASRPQFHGNMVSIFPIAFGIAGFVVGGVGGILGGLVFPVLPKGSAKTAGI